VALLAFAAERRVVAPLLLGAPPYYKQVESPYIHLTKVAAENIFL